MDIRNGIRSVPMLEGWAVQVECERERDRERKTQRVAKVKGMEWSEQRREAMKACACART